MESKYNEFSKIQLETIKSNSRLIEKSINLLIHNLRNQNDINPNRIIKILDIGASHGRNSLIPLNIIISNLIKENSNLTFEVYHEDLPCNSWERLFNEILENSSSYIKLSNQIYYYGIGKSFYHQVVPSNSIDFTFSFSSSHWSTFNPNIYHNPDSLIMIYQQRTPQYNKHCFDCLYNNLSNRAKELKSGGIFIITIMNENEQLSPQDNTIYQYFKLMKQIWYQMSNDNLISRQLVEKMVIPINFYKKFEVDKVIEMLENQDQLKLVSIEQHLQTFDNVELSDLDKSELLFKYINVASEYSIKTFLPGDSNHKDTLYNLFKNKFINHIKNNNTNQIQINNLYSYYSVIFEKNKI